MSESGRRIAVPGKVPDRLRSFFAKRPEDRGHQLAHSSRLGLCRRIIVKVPLQYGHFLRWLVISRLTWDISASARQGRQQKRCGLPSRIAGYISATSAGGRTGLFISELKGLLVAIPRKGIQDALVRVYQVQ
jgi:hypothetical protein